MQGDFIEEFKNKISPPPPPKKNQTLMPCKSTMIGEKAYIQSECQLENKTKIMVIRVHIKQV